MGNMTLSQPVDIFSGLLGVIQGDKGHQCPVSIKQGYTIISLKVVMMTFVTKVFDDSRSMRYST